jgi:Flp pilus assembly protein TadB
MMTALIARTIVVAAYVIAVLMHQPIGLMSAVVTATVLAVWTVALIRDRGRLRKPIAAGSLDDP